MSPKAKCYAFYSYKGGSGRSTTCINTLLHLVKKMDASPQHPILLVDTDLESAGLTYFFNCTQKFTSKLSGAIDAATLLSGGIAETNAAWIFGKDLITEAKNVPVDVIKDLEKSGITDAAELFGDIRLYPQEKALLNAVVNSYTNRKTHSPSSVGNEEGEIQKKGGALSRVGAISDALDYDHVISRYCNMGEIIPALRREKDPDKKRKILVDKMPATQFVDISHYFACLPGTIMFLGVDLNFQKEQVVRNAATKYIRTMLDYAGQYGYRAIIFDSSAGVQSTAHALQWVSDVIVCCMRPSRQFIMGTNEQLKNYQDIMIRKINEYREEGQSSARKAIILLPTVVPSSDEYAALKKESFDTIKKVLLAKAYLEFIDDYFCNSENALNEISFFKWREQILGVPDININTYSSEIQKVIESVSSEENVNAREDTRRAYTVYDELADHLIMNSEIVE